MAKKKKRRGVKVYKPHNVGTILYAIFGLGVVACLVIFALMPMFSCVKEGEAAITFTGLEYLEFCLRKFAGRIMTLPAQIAPFEALLANETSNVLLQNIQKFHEYIELGIGAVFALSVIWALFEVLMSLFMLIFGKSNHPKGIKTFGWLIFWFFAIAYGLSYMYFVFIMQIAGEGVTIKPDNLSLIALGAMFVGALFLTIIYRICLKDRIPLIKNKRRKDDDDDDDDEEEEVEVSPRQVNQEQNIPQEAQPVQPSVDNNQSVITIGNSAYKKNIDITTANIPEGIAVLGSSAFANCVNLAEVNLPASLREISFNCFFNTPKLTRINYAGSVELWKTIKRGSNWLSKSGTKTVYCKDGQINVNPSH